MNKPKEIKYSQTVKYPKIIQGDNTCYYFIKKYDKYAMYLSEYGIRECFTPVQLQDAIFKSNKPEMGV